MNTREFQTGRQQQVDRYLPWTMGVLGFAGSVAFFISTGLGIGGQGALFTAAAAPWQVALIGVPATAALTVTSFFTARWFARTIMRQAHTWWGSLLWGAGLGIVTGAAITTSGWLLTLAMGDPMGIIDTGMVGAAGYLAVLGMSIVSGGLWGGLAGLIPGAVIGPAIHLYTSRER